MVGRASVPASRGGQRRLPTQHLLVSSRDENCVSFL
jgi:hypothetical protein